MRRPQRLNVFALACEADKRGRTGLFDQRYPQATQMLAEAAAAREISAGPILARGIQGPAIAQALDQARIAAIALRRREGELAGAT